MIITKYGLILFGLSIVSFFLFLRRGQKAHLTDKEIETLALLYLGGGLVGARLYHLLTQSYLYRHQPQAGFFFWRGGMGIFGFLGSAFLITLLVAWQRKKPVRLYLDLLAPLLLLAQGLGRGANIINRELLPFAYWEMALDLTLAAFLFYAEKKKIFSWGEGRLFASAAIGYGGGRFFLETLRSPRLKLPGFSFTQWVSLAWFLLGCYFFATWKKAFFVYNKKDNGNANSDFNPRHSCPDGKKSAPQGLD